MYIVYVGTTTLPKSNEIIVIENVKTLALQET